MTAIAVKTRREMVLPGQAKLEPTAAPVGYEAISILVTSGLPKTRFTVTSFRTAAAGRTQAKRKG